MEDFQAYWQVAVSRVDQALDRYMPAADLVEERLHEAMRYSVFAGGKRLRPLLCLTVAQACGLSEEALLPAACALEMVHTYSLIHDDLPAMDDDDYRRGKLTNHKVFGEATALLAGDALLTCAFETLLASDVPASSLVLMVKELAQASGAAGMIGGQMGDMAAEGRAVTRTELESIHARKTGALLLASARIPVIAAGCDDVTTRAVTAYAKAIGLAFQIQDDVLDVSGDPVKMGKSVGADVSHDKATFPSLIGLTASRELIHELTEQAVEVIVRAPRIQSERLVQLAEYLRSRDR